MTAINEFLISPNAQKCLRRDGWYPGRRCPESELAKLHEQLHIGNGPPPSKTIIDFVEEFGGLELRRPVDWVFAFNSWYLPHIRPRRFERLADLKVYSPVSVCEINDVRRIAGHVFWIGTMTGEGWNLFVDNSIRFFTVDYIGERVIQFADSIGQFFDDLYGRRAASWLEIGAMRWSDEE